jgi:formyl-CoA transferase
LCFVYCSSVNLAQPFLTIHRSGASSDSLLRCKESACDGSEACFDCLDNLTVLDLTRVRSGPTCVRQLADWGANVIKIEMPEEGRHIDADRLSARHEPDFQNLHRNKRSMTLNSEERRGLRSSGACRTRRHHR